MAIFSVGEKLRNYRLSRDLTLKDVAYATGISVSYLSDIERNRTLPSLRMLDRLVMGYGISMSVFFIDTAVYDTSE